MSKRYVKRYRRQRFYPFPCVAALHFLLSISSCPSLCASFRARTGLWAWTASTSVMGTTGKKMCRWSFSHTMRELTVGSPFPLPTLRQFPRTKSRRWVSAKRRSPNVDAPENNCPVLLQQITSSYPSHPANSFFYPRLKHLPPIAKVTLTKVKKTNQIISLPEEPTQSNQLPTGNEIEDKLISKSEQ